MGLFSTKKTIVVSSTVYNMAGEEANRPNFLKSTMFAAIMNPNGGYLGESIVQGYLGGPGINQRSLFNYAVRNDYPGLPTYSISQSIEIDPEVVRPFISIPGSPAGLELIIQDATISDGDYEVFAEKYMNENFPNEINTDWMAEYNKDDHTITIQRAGGGTVTFGAGIYDPAGRFVLCNHYFVLPENPLPVDEGALTGPVTSGLPSTTGFTLTSTTNTGLETYEQDQTRVITKVYSSGAPTTVNTDYPHIETDFNTVYTIHEKEVYNGGDGDNAQTSTTNTLINIWEYRQVYASSSSVTVVNDMGGGETETVTTEITGDFLRTVYDHRTDTQDTLLSSPVGGNKVFIYKIGSGNATLDVLNVSVGSAVTAEFFPFVPLRLNNVSITDPIYEDVYAASKTLYRRATKKQRLEDLVEEVEDNEDLEEIDYAYVQWAVTLNSSDKEALKYIYTFWKNLIPVHGLPSDYLSAFQATTTAYENSLSGLDDWTLAQADPGDPLYGTPKPDVPSLGSPQTTTLQFKTEHAQLQDFDNRISFCYIDENVFTGIGKDGAVKGDLWMTKGTPFSWITSYGVRSGDDNSYTIYKTNTMETLNVFWQTESNQYKRVTVYGAVHENFVYGGKAVRINSSEAFDDVDDSGFLIPLHMPSLKEAGLVSATQLATANTYIVFNSYQIFKKKWYETFLGMLFIIILVVVAVALVAPGFVGGLGGVFGTNAAVGAGLGLSGIGAIVAGAVANVLAGVVIAQALAVASTAIFGAKWGAIIAALLSFAISFGLSGGFNNLASIFQPNNLLSLTSALANGYSGFVQANITEMQADMFKVGEEYEKEMDKIKDLMAELMGNDLAFNPMSLTDAAKGNGSGTGSYLPESLDDFIQRTTLTGSDIVDMTLSIVNDFADLSLSLPRT